MFKTPLKILLAASIAFPAALVTDVANAGHKKKRHHHNNHHYSAPYNYGGHSSYGGYSRHHYKPHHSGYYYGGYYGQHGHHGHHGKAGTYLGVALLGLGVGYVLSKSNDRDERYYSAPPPPPQNYYNQPQSYGAPQTYNQPQSFDFSQCRETREYQTTIYVDGQAQEAYGTACLMPDGNWVAGPMRLGN